MLDGPQGLLATYGSYGGRWHADAILELHANSATEFGMGVRGWYHLHSASYADFSVGGGIGLFTTPTSNNGTSSRRTDAQFEAGGLIRAFLVPNVALLSSIGAGFGLGDKNDFLLSGQFVASMGVAYFFSP